MSKWLNKKTGKVWDVRAEDVIRRMRKSADYEEVKDDGVQTGRQEQRRQKGRRKKEVGETDGGQPVEPESQA